jgi:hypothetical protein
MDILTFDTPIIYLERWDGVKWAGLVWIKIGTDEELL